MCFVLLICLILKNNNFVLIFFFFFLQGHGCFIFPPHSASRSCVNGRSKGGRDGARRERKGRNEIREKAAAGRGIELRREKGRTGSLAVPGCSLAKSRPAQDVNKLICQCEVFTHFSFAPGPCDSCSVTSDAGRACCCSAGVFSSPCSRGHRGGAGPAVSQ